MSYKKDVEAPLDGEKEVIPSRRRNRNKKKNTKKNKEKKVNKPIDEVAADNDLENDTSAKEENIENQKVDNSKIENTETEQTNDEVSQIEDSIFSDPELIDSQLDIDSDKKEKSEENNSKDNTSKEEKEDDSTDNSKEEKSVKKKHKNHNKKYDYDFSPNTNKKSNRNDPFNKKNKKEKEVELEEESTKKYPILGVSIAIILVLLAGAVVAGHIYFSSHWYYNTILNDQKVEYFNLQQTTNHFKNIYDKYSITYKGRDDMSCVVKKDDIDLSIDATNDIKEAFDKQHETFYIIAFFRPQELTINPEISYSEEKFNDILLNSELIKGSEDKKIVAPQDACAKLDDEKGYFIVADEVNGNTLNQEKFLQVANETLKEGFTEVNLDDAKKYPDMFLAPSIKADADGLKEACDTYNQTVLRWVNWKMTDNATISITPQDIKEWYDMDENFKVTLNEAKVEKWVENFCLKYKTVGVTRNFKTHSGNIVKVVGGDYGWQINYDATLKQLKDVLNADCSDKIKAFMADPSDANKAALTTNYDVRFKNKGYALNTIDKTQDYNLKNYSEISITEQKVYVYKDGQLAYTANCITGLPIPAKETTKGCFYIKEKLRNKTLTGPGYSTPVSYWLRITWSGIGYHDATWQAWGAWNPNRYKSVGSHGCINLSMTDVAKIYDLISVGDPVFVY